MPSVSRRQQRLFQAVAHKASFPLARKIRATMTAPQIKDFTVRSPAAPAAPAPTRPLHPALHARAMAVQAVHAHLSKTVPGFRSKPPAEQFAHTQRYVRTRLTRRG